MKKILFIIPAVLIATILVAAVLTTIDDFFLPGSQIGQSGNIETPDKCDNCHGGYDQAVEPAFNWRGSMMSQSARDPLFYACLAIANQDAPDVGDMCLRCHTPDGWLNGRCVPTDGSALNNNDRQGVQCDFCHKMVKPTPLGVNPFPEDPLYNSSVYGSVTYNQDQSYLTRIIPIPGTTANGMYIADANNAKRGPFSNATGRHQMLYSPFHSQSDHCGTCHDVSNPAFTRIAITNPDYLANTFGVQSPTFDLRLMFPVERTFSEWKASGYAIDGDGIDNKTCQDCHMRDVTGKGAKMKDAPLRTNLPLHDMTGGNTFVPNLIKQAYPAEVNAAALDAGIERARNTLKSAADLELTVANNTATVKVINKTGHKLPTGYPEGRRIWINVKFFDASNNLIAESGTYNYETAELAKQGTKIYECEPGISPEVAAVTGLPAGPSFHFAINSMIYFDNRIPPAGFSNARLIEGQSPVVDHDAVVSTTMYPDGQNFDLTSYTLPAGTTKVEAKLYYQTTSKEYVEFLRDENTTNTKGQELYDMWVTHGKSAPELMKSAIWPVAVPQLTAEIVSVTRITSKQGVYAQALVNVRLDGNPVSGATVSASYTGPTNGSVSGVSNSSGQVLLNTTKIKNPVGSWCFTLTNAAYTGAVYVPNTIQVCETTAKNLIAEDNTISDATVEIYPNPMVDKLYFDIASPEETNLTIEIFTMTGQKVATVYSGRIPANSADQFEFSPATKTKGILVYRVTLGNQIYHGKILSTN
jgi:mono/diheme cytochrome c family protein